MENRALGWGDRLARWSIAAIFLAAATPKLFHVSDFAAVIKAYAILPEPLLLPTAVALPVVEILLAFGLLANAWHSKVGSALLLLLFLAFLGHAIWLGLDIDCGCFGPEDPEYTAFHGLRGAVLRDLLMFLPLGYSFWYDRYRHFNFQLQGEERR